MTTTPRTLPTFRGWTVDVRLREFRQVYYHPEDYKGTAISRFPAIRFLPFNSPAGRVMIDRATMQGEPWTREVMQ